MAQFSIISASSGEVLYTGSPRYIGAYLRPAYLEFQEIASPEPIPWSIGDYIVYSRTATTFRLYTLPKVTKRATALRYGGSFSYENVQLFDDAKQLDLCPFSDIVPGDNRIHFSTQDSFSFFGTPYGVRDRIAACLQDMYPGEWEVRVAPGLPAEFEEEKDFSASGLTVLGALDRTYEIWPGLGWTRTVENGKNILIIGGANVRNSANTTEPLRYDAGLTRLSRSVGNADELTTRLYGYGSMRNMPAGYYKNKPIRDAQSVDIEHLMIPISSWGLTGGLPDPSKAYVEDASAFAKYGLIPKKVYFDGSDSRYPEIFPSIEGITAGKVRSIKSSLGETDYVPSASKWPGSARIDALVTGTSLTDDGNAAPEGKKYVETSDEVVSVEQTVVITRDVVNIEPAVVVLQYTPAHDENCTTTLVSKVQGTIGLEAGSYAPDVHAYLCFKDPTGHELLGFADISAPVRLNQVSSGQWSFTIPRLGARYEAADGIWLVLGIARGDAIEGGTDGTPRFTVSVNGTVSVSIAADLVETFTVRIPQIGFNIEEQAAIGEGMTVSMKTGMCAARDFKIESCEYDSSADAWILTLWRSYDEDLGTWFPNSNFQLVGGDRFVLLDIAMPELYILAQSERLLDEVQKLLDDACEEKPFYEPEIDSKYVNDNLVLLREGMYMHLVSDEIVDGGEDYAIIDTLEIDEAASNIPVYSLKLRMRKATGWTTATGASTSRQSSSVETLGYIESLVRESRRLAQRTFLSAKETAQMLIDAALDGYTEQISPIAIQTMQLLVGDERLQFKFWADSLCTQPIDPVHYNASTKQVTFDDAYLQHMTLGIDAITPASGRRLSDYLIWEMDGRTTASLADPEKRFYLYAKCDALNDGTSHNTGGYVIDEDSHQMYEEEEEGGVTRGYYYFLIGLLNSEQGDDRSYAPLYGFTEILPGQITTDLLRSADGRSWLDMALNQMRLGDAHKSFSWNLNNSGEFLVDGGTINVKSSGGNVRSMITCDRGAFDPLATYYYGDEVYTADGARYVYINPTSSSVAPPNATYWKLKQAAGSTAKLVSIAASSLVFTYESSSSSTPTGDTSITLTCLTQNILNPTYKWYYKNNSNIWTQISGETSSTLTVAHDNAAFLGGKVADIKVIVNDDTNLYDVVSLYKVYGGTDAISAFLTNTSHLFAAGTASAADGSDTYEVVVFRGATRLTCGANDGFTINENGITISPITVVPYPTTDWMMRVVANKTGNVQNGTITVTVTQKLNIPSGTVTIPIVVGSETFNLVYSWALSLTGAKGSAGARLRGPTVWDGISYYESGENSDFQDVVYYVDSNGDAQYYLCIEDVPSGTESNPNPDPKTDTGHWKRGSHFDFVASDISISLRSKIVDLTVNKLTTENPNSPYAVIKIAENQINIANSEGVDKVKITSGNLPSGGETSGTYNLSSSTQNIAPSVADASGTIEVNVGSIAIDHENNRVAIPTLSFTLNYTSTSITGGINATCSLWAGGICLASHILQAGTGHTSHSAQDLARTISLPVTPANSPHIIKLVIEYTATGESAVTGSLVFTRGNTSRTITYPAEFTMIATDGAQFRYGTEGFKTTSGGAKVIQGGTAYNMAGIGTLDGLTAPKRIVFCKTYPDPMSSDVFYIKVQQSS